MDFLVPPWEHQKLAVERARELPYYALFFEQGAGKTSTLINILREKFVDEENPLRTLILCPPIVIDNWKREIGTYSRIPERKVITLTGSSYFRLSRTDLPEDAIYITNYQALLMPKLYQRFLTFGFKVVVLDESHKIKTYNSKTTKCVQALGQRATYRYCLSGTPILNTAFDIFPQVLFLDQGKTFGPKFNDFRSKYFHDFNAGMPRHCYFPNWKIKPTATAEINEAIRPLSSRVLKKDCLDLPPLIRQRIDCGLTDEQADAYRQLEKDFVATIGDGRIITDLELTKGLRLQQIVSGYCPNEEGKIHEFKANIRLGAVQDLLDGISRDHKVIIWACFRENFRQLESLCSALSLPFVSVYGGVSQSEQVLRCKSFEDDPRTRVLIGHPKSCGVGVNLTSASYSIFYSRSFSLEDDLQAEARNYRGGSERHQSITRIDLVTPGTIDEVILEALASKQSLSDAILKHIQKKRENPCYRLLPNGIQL
jgi:SNF2 family DNA or RNA helicase